jgi:Transposase and inactivated derivatives
MAQGLSLRHVSKKTPLRHRPGLTVRRVPRVPRSHLAEFGFFHAYARGVDRMAIARDEADRNAWVALLGRSVGRFELSFRAYCLMPNHFHLVVACDLGDSLRRNASPERDVCAAFQSQARADRASFRGPVRVRAIDDEAYLHDVCAYVLANPVRAGLCESVDDWPWSAQAS